MIESSAINMNRRSLLAAMGFGGMAMLGGCASVPSISEPFFQRVGLPIGLQIYTLGDDAMKDVDATFASVAEIGYKTLELPNLGKNTPAQVRAAADRAGLSIASLHTPLMQLPGGLGLATPAEELSEVLQTLGASWAVAPLCMLPSDFRPKPGEEFSTAIARSLREAGSDIWKKSAAFLNERAAALAPYGVKVGYHNHNVEFAPVGSSSGWDILWNETDPSLVHFELDIGWVSTAGFDTVEFVEKYGSRVSLMHVKDVAADNKQSFEIAMSPAEVGYGVLPFDRILPAAYKAGVRNFFVEQEPPFTIPRIEAARRSYETMVNLKG